jgi:hypothetical protein
MSDEPAYFDALPPWRSTLPRPPPGHTPDAELAWSGYREPQPIGGKVRVHVNGLGPGTVTGYWSQAGYLGVMVKLESPPKWYDDQRIRDGRDRDAPCHVFGAELGSPS